MRRRGAAAAGTLALALFCFSPDARADGDIDIAAGLGAGVSFGNGWEGDGAIPYGATRLAYRFGHWIGPVAYGRQGYGKVDQRLLTLVGLGAQAWLPLQGVSPWFRLAWAHQHEEFIESAKEEPFGVLFGVGRSVRHRGGLTFGAGADVPFAKSKKLEWFVAGEAFADWLFAGEAPGPTWYAGGMVSIGLNITP
jgi:hypothetical protein